MRKFAIGDLVKDNGKFVSNEGRVGVVTGHPYSCWGDECYYVVFEPDDFIWFYKDWELSPVYSTPKVNSTPKTVLFDGVEYPLSTVVRPKVVDLDETDMVFDTPYRRIRKDDFGYYVRSMGKRVEVSLKGVS